MDVAHLPRLSFECPASLLTRLRARYDEPHRRYHTWTHVLACFEAKAQLTDAASAAVDLALLFHDAVYEPLAHDNEARSAQLMVDEGGRAWLDARWLARAEPLVLATAHGAGELALGEEASIVVDADLSILGAAPDVFAAYERGVREEYAVVPEDAFAAGRRRVLSGLLARPSLYATRTGRALWEARARANVTSALAGLA